FATVTPCANQVTRAFHPAAKRRYGVAGVCRGVLGHLDLGAMFTGIVEKSARVIGVVAGPKFCRITLALDWPDVRDGESVAVNGACLTVASRAPGELGFDVIKETLD